MSLIVDGTGIPGDFLQYADHCLKLLSVQPEQLIRDVLTLLNGYDACRHVCQSEATHIHRALVRLPWCRLYPDTGLAGMPAGWFHGEHGTRVLIAHRSCALADDACEHLSELADGRGDGLSQWLLPASLYEQPIRDEDLEFVAKHLAGRAIENFSHA
jgi:hypothetical protein